MSVSVINPTIPGALNTPEYLGMCHMYVSDVSGGDTTWSNITSPLQGLYTKEMLFPARMK